MPRREAGDENAVGSVLRALRRMIFDGELRANQPLRQEELALQLGTSRHPVREALGRLSGEGLVTFRPRLGYIVTALGPEEITEIFDMRMVLEEHAGYLATVRRTAADVEGVGEILQKMAALRQTGAEEMRLWSEHNRAFHARLFAASGRGHLCRTIGTLRDAVESYIRVSVADDGLAQAWEAHREIFEGFRDGDALHVARLCRRHVRHSAHALLERLRLARDGDAGAPADRQAPVAVRSGVT